METNGKFVEWRNLYPMLLGVFIAFSGLVGAGITLHAQKGHHDITRTELEALFNSQLPWGDWLPRLCP